jgi:hypothetical protein
MTHTDRSNAAPGEPYGGMYHLRTNAVKALDGLSGQTLSDRLLSALRQRDELRAAFVELLEVAEDMRSYVPDYFAEKWKHDEGLAVARAAFDEVKR